MRGLVIVTRKKTFNEIMHEKFASHTSPPAPDKPRPPCEECIYQERIDKAAKAGREQVLDELFEWIEKEKRGCDNPDMCLFTTKEMQEKVESLRGAQEEQGGESE